MAGPENLQSNDYEAVLMRSDLAELFQANIAQAAIHQPFDLHDPAEVVLGGTYKTPNDETVLSRIHVRQRIDEYGVDYIVGISEKGYHYWYQITDRETCIIWSGRPAMVFDDMVAIRWRIRPGTTHWDRPFSEKLADQENPYLVARRFI